MAFVSWSEGFSAALTGGNLFQHILGLRHERHLVLVARQGGFGVFNPSVCPHIIKEPLKNRRGIDHYLRKALMGIWKTHSF